MQKLNKILLSALIMLISTLANAQTAEMADGMRTNGKIYVVVSIILVIVIGFIIYLALLDRKITRIEKQLGNRK